MTTFQRAFYEALLWSTTDDHEQPLDANYTLGDIAEETRAALDAECDAFEAAWGERFRTAEHGQGQWSTTEHAGYDFALTRNHHGVGFWDGDWPEPLATDLTAACNALREVELYVGDDGKLYASGYERPTATNESEQG